MGRARTAAVYVLPAAAIIVAWLRIETPPRELGRAVLVALVALVPALALRLRVRLALTAGALVLGSWIALGASVATPGRLVTRLWDGTRQFYDVDLPFDPTTSPRMQSAVLLAIFVFCLLVGLALSSRHALLAVLVLAFGAGWPGTLVWGGSELLLGGLILAGALVILAGLRPRAKRAVVPAVVAGGLVVACALGLASRPAVAKDELLHWQGWDLYTKSDPSVGVGYVWDSNYGGLDWPRKKTAVLKIEAPDTPFYWRATVLGAYVDDRWLQDLQTMEPFVFAGDRAELVPWQGRSRKGWIPQQVTIEALRDRHLVGAEEPVAYAPRGIGSVSYARGGIALLDRGTSRGQTYTVWSSVRRPTPQQLVKSKPRYPMDILVARAAYVPPFGAPGRDRRVRETIASRAPAYESLYAAAKRIAGHAKNPYAAVVGLETWLRDSGEFTYDEHPPSVPGVPALAAFVTQTHRGYCQHFAGAMALMLRYLGIPARVAAGFASGTFSDHFWTVTDHDAHTWVEVWFRDWGWLPFDPTPGRGRLSASYSASSKSFDAGAAAALVGAGAIQRLLQKQAFQSSSTVRGEHARSVPVAPESNHRTFLVIGLVLVAILGLGVGLFAFKAGGRRARYLSDDPRRVAAACRRELSEILVDQRVEVPRSATLHELGELFDSRLEIGASVLVEAAGGARFAAPRAAAEAAARVRGEARELRRVLRRRLSLFERLSGALSLRSLRSA